MILCIISSMTTQSVLSTINPGNHFASLLDPAKAPSPRNSKRVSSNSTEFHEISPNSTGSETQVPESEGFSRKPVGGTFAEKISPEQRSTLFEWLADHTYDEVVDLVAAEPPAGFGIKVGKSTICRFYKANFREIDAIRQAHVESRALLMVDGSHDRDYRYVLRHSTAQLLLERLWELLSRPVESADELKKLVAVAAKMKSLDLDKDDEFDAIHSILQLAMPQGRRQPTAPVEHGPSNPAQAR